MSSTLLPTRHYGSPGPLLRASPPSIALGLALLLLACAKGATLPNAPSDVLHYPAWMAYFESTAADSPIRRQLLVVNLDQDLAYNNGAVVAIDASPNLETPGPGASNARQVLGGVAVSNMAGRLLVVDATTAAGCAGHFDAAYTVPFALVAGRFDNTLDVISLAEAPRLSVSSSPLTAVSKISLNPFSASEPLGVGFTCGADGIPRAWVGYQAGQNNTGYVTRVNLDVPPGAPDSMVQVNVGLGPVRSFAYDADHDRLYFTGTEVNQSAPIRWIQVGSGCNAATDGIQDERNGGCHVDPGFDLSLQFRGAEPNDIALSSRLFECTAGPFAGGNCRRMYLSVRMYDADLAAFLGGRPTTDVGGKLMVLEVPEGGLGRPEPQLVSDLDIGMIAGSLQVIPRPVEHDLVAVTAVDDAVVWLYDDQVGAMVKVFGRDASGIPPLGHDPVAVASQDLGGGKVRLFVTSYSDNWVSAADVDLANPAGAMVVLDPLTGSPWRLGVAR
jgi:hypothetical protein